MDIAQFVVMSHATAVVLCSRPGTVPSVECQHAVRGYEDDLSTCEHTDIKQPKGRSAFTETTAVSGEEQIVPGLLDKYCRFQANSVMDSM